MSTRIKVLLFTRTAAYRHASIAALAAALSSLSSIELSHTEDSSLLQSSLYSHDVLVLGHNTGNFLDEAALAAVMNFVRAEGKGLVGIHACTAGMLDRADYAELLGARFAGHPEPQWARIKVHHRRDEEDHYILRGLPPPSSPTVPSTAPACPPQLHASENPESSFPWFDEWYNFNPAIPFPPLGSTLLVTVDPATYDEGPALDEGQRTNQHPLVWCHEIDGSTTRVFYTALGHFDEAYSDAWFMAMLERAIWWTSRRHI